jgi:hypothetical protein
MVRYVIRSHVDVNKNSPSEPGCFRSVSLQLALIPAAEAKLTCWEVHRNYPLVGPLRCKCRLHGMLHKLRSPSHFIWWLPTRAVSRSSCTNSRLFRVSMHSPVSWGSWVSSSSLELECFKGFTLARGIGHASHVLRFKIGGSCPPTSNVESITSTFNLIWLLLSEQTTICHSFSNECLNFFFGAPLVAVFTSGNGFIVGK